MMTTPQDTEAAAATATSPTGTEARVCADITRRQALGLAKYGTTVEANPLPLPAWLQHAYEETLDQAIYLRRAMEEIAAPQVEQQAERRLTRKARVGGTLFEVGVPERLVLDAAQLAAQRPQGLIDDSVKRELQQLIADNAGRAAFLDAHPAVSQELAGLIEENERLRAALTDQQASQGPAVGAEDAGAEGLTLHLVLSPNGEEGVAFVDKADALYTATGRRSGGFGVPAIGEAFRDAYDEADSFEVIEVRAVPKPPVADGKEQP